MVANFVLYFNGTFQLYYVITYNIPNTCHSVIQIRAIISIQLIPLLNKL